MFESLTPGNDLLNKELEHLEAQNERALPSLNAFLHKHNMFMTKVDIKTLRGLLVNNKKWKLETVTDYRIVRRGKKKC